jgi:hypothetical protein
MPSIPVPLESVSAATVPFAQSCVHEATVAKLAGVTVLAVVGVAAVHA